ncbi:hypothetical protein ABFS82_11G074400 [Erythranthe guttata]
MGRRKLEMKEIENNSARMVCFSKRRSGLIKKAKELSVLCDVDVATIFFSKSGKLYQYCSTDRIAPILERYRIAREQLGASSTGYSEAPMGQSSEHPGFIITRNGLLRNFARDLNEACIDELSVTDLILLQKQTEAALIQISSTKTQMMLDTISTLREQKNMLAKEKRRLEEIIQSQIPGMNRNASRKKKKMIDLDLNVVADASEMTE